MAEEVGVGYVRLIPSMKGFRKAAERELRGELRDPARKAGDDAGDESGRRFTSSFGKALKPNGTLNSKVKSLAGGVLKAFGGALTVGNKSIAVTAATAFSAQFLTAVASGLASGVAKIGRGLGSVAALAPAAIGAGVLALGSLKLALSGVGDALEAGLSGDTEKFNEALKAMPPPARKALREIAGLKGRFDGLRQSVQGAFFAPLVGQIRPLAETYMPALEGVMSGISRTAGQSGNALSNWLQVPSIADQVRGALLNMGVAVSDVIVAASILPQAFLPLVTVGSSFLPQLADGLGGAAARFRDFMNEAARTGRLHDFIQRGLDDLRALWHTGGQVVRILRNIGDIASVVFGGLRLSSGGLLDSLEGLTERAMAFVRTARGSELVGQVFQTVGALAGLLFGTLQALGQILVPFIPAILQIVEAVATLKTGIIGGAVDAFGRLANAIGPILPQVGEFVSALNELAGTVIDTGLDALEPVVNGLADALGAVLPTITDFITMIAGNQQVIQAVGIGIAAVLVPAFLSWAASAAAAAISTLAALAPIILIGAAIAALAYLVIHNWDTIKKATAAVFSWIGDHWEILLAVLTGGISLAVGWIISHWGMIQDAIGAVFSWIGDHWGMLLSFLSLPLAIFVGVVVTQWEHIRAFIGTVFGFIAAVASAVLGAIGRVVAFVAGVVIGYWRAIGNAAVGAWNTIWAKTAFIRDAIVGAVTWVRDKITGAFDSVRDHVVGVWDSIKNAIAGVVEWIANKVDTVKGWISDIGDAVSSIPGAGIVKDVGGFLGFDVGGVVPGPKGAPMLAVVHGGETVVPTHDAGAMRGFAADPQFTSAQRAALSSSRAIAPAPARLVVDVGNGTDDLVKVIRKWIANNSTGDVQVALGR